MTPLKWAVAGLLVLHTGWIGNHMRWVMNEEINPWKLGGYAMYTIPNPGQRIRIYDAPVPGEAIKANALQFEAATRFTNANRTFRCAGIPAAALRGFFNENKDLIGRNLMFAVSERRFYRDPPSRPSLKREAQGLVIVTWQDAQNFSYTSSFCGREETRSASLS
jgi:hypothetical protein